MRSFDAASPHVSGSVLSFQQVATVLGALTLFRIAGLYVSHVDLFMDEAQYWDWSRELAYGYFSKPPLLAWIISATSHVCGDGEACVRVSSPLLHFATSLIVYAIADTLYGRPAAAWAALAYGFGTAVAFSARIVSTDVPLLFFWAAALLAMLKLMVRPNWRWAVVLGVSLGLGLLAKYAMVYVLLCAGCVACFDRNARAFLKQPQTWAALAIALALVLPNLVWNADNGFATFRHTGDNISGSGLTFRPKGVLDFVGAQFAVAGPLVFATFLYLLARLPRNRFGREDVLMLCFAIPPLALVVALSFFRSAHANWAAPSVVAMTVLAVGWWQRNGWRSWFGVTVGLGVLVQIVLVAGDAFADRLSIPLFGKPIDPYHRTLGWRALGDRTAAFAKANNAQTVAVEGRPEVAALTYYLRDQPLQTVAWSANATPNNQFDLAHPLDNAAKEPVLFISACPIASRLQRFYGKTTPLGPFSVSTGPTTQLQFYAFVLSERRQSIGPLGGCAEVPR
jgi:4-amino-4-deoxy-L-arabinose transferase-like glycosyltransferase